MQISYDVETYKKVEKYYEPVLDATGEHFKVGCIYFEDGKGETFFNAREMWNRIIELGKIEAKKGKKLHAYAHNARYDFYNICEVKDKSIHWFSENPFIASYYDTVERVFESEQKLTDWLKYAEINNIKYTLINSTTITYKKEIIKFLDSIAIFRMALKKVGELIEIPKTEMPLGKWERLTPRILNNIAKYCMNDCKVTMEAILFLKKKLANDGVNIRNLCTINQVAISYVINKLVKLDTKGQLLYITKENKVSEWMHRTKYADDIHQAYRASLTRVWKTGKFDKVTYLDKSSLYPSCITKINLPILKTERKVFNPLNIYTPEDLFNKIGLSKVMLYNKNNDLGLIPIRTTERSYVPKSGKYIIGTYTNMELKVALKEGYEILDVEWSILYDKGENLLKPIYEELYKKRMQDNDSFNKYFYKCMMNSSIGKFGQRRTNQLIFIDSIEKAKEYLDESTKIIRGIDRSTDVMYKQDLQARKKKYYAPILPALTTAQARIDMYYEFKKIPLSDLLYTDTDSIIFTGNHLDKFEIGSGLGQFKIEKDKDGTTDLVDKKCIIWGTKCKSVGENITVSGAFKSELTMENFEKGIAFTKRMQGIKSVRGEDTGKFIEEIRDLAKQKETFEEVEVLLDNELIYIDHGTTNVEYFIPQIDKIIGITS